jgi:energy-coupling factor transport system permease protein
VVLPFFRPRDSPLHALHPGAKLALAFGVLVASLLLSHPAYLLALIAGTVVLATAGRVLREWWRFVRLFGVVALTVVAINALASLGGDTVLWEGPMLPNFGRVAISLEGLAFGSAMAMRLLAAVSAFTVLSLTLHPDDLTRLMSGRAYRSGLALSLSTRLYPVVVRDASAIVDAQRSRGLDLDSGGRLARFRNRLPVAVPLFHSSLERAVGIAEAMEARGFGSGPRTRWRPRPWTVHDALALGCSAAIVAAAALLVLWVAGSPTYYPVMDIPLGLTVVVWSVVLLALAALPAAAPSRRPMGGGAHG